VRGSAGTGVEKNQRERRERKREREGERERESGIEEGERGGEKGGILLMVDNWEYKFDTAEVFPTICEYWQEGREGEGERERERGRREGGREGRREREFITSINLTDFGCDVAHLFRSTVNVARKAC
jgi:hypothetical protein